MNQQTQRWPPEKFCLYLLLIFKLLKRMKNEMSLDQFETLELTLEEKNAIDGGINNPEGCTPVIIPIWTPPSY